MELAISVDILISEFWKMTPIEINMVAEDYFKKERKMHEEKVTLAYLNAAWTIQWLGKKSNHPKPLEEILKIKKEKKIMTDDEMFKQAQLLNSLFGGEEV